jgi:hypothetical protein
MKGVPVFWLELVLISLNTRMSRTFALTERVRLEVIAEDFNTLNNSNDMIPNTTWGTGTYPTNPNSSFGQATAVGDAECPTGSEDQLLKQP